MTRVYYDSETFSDVDLKLGVHRYCEGEQFEVMVSTYAIDDGPVVVLDHTAGDPISAELRDAAADPSVEWVVHGSMFDRTVTRTAGLFDVPIERWHCTMTQALLHGLPGGLEKLCHIFKLPEDLAKINEGKELIQLFCKPRPSTWKLRRATRETHPTEWARFLEYAAHDILAMRELYKRIPQWNFSAEEKRLWHIDQRANDRGIAVDLDLARAAIVTVTAEQKRLNARGEELSGGEVTRLTQRDKLIEHLLSIHGVALPDMSASTLERRMQDESLPSVVRDILAMRLDVSKSSTTKYKTMVTSANADGRLRGLLQFGGAARTRRDAGRRVQPQNFIRTGKAWLKMWEEAVAIVKAGDAPIVFDSAIEACSQLLRAAFIASQGRKLVVGDLANIEGRFTAWVAGEEWKIKAFREFDAGTGPDLYLVSYAKAFGLSVEEVIRLHKAGQDVRQIGKVNELACGYQGAVGAWQTMARIYGVDIFDEAALASVKAWRKGHPKTVSLWYRLEDCARHAVANPGVQVPVNDKLTFEKWKAWLLLHLPSGRRLCYPQASVDGDGKISYVGVNPYTRQWGKLHIYGGKFLENVAQSGSRDVMFHPLPALEDLGFTHLLRVHDELINEIDEDADGALEAMLREMSTPPPWALDLPLAAEGFEGFRYKKG